MGRPPSPQGDRRTALATRREEGIGFPGVTFRAFAVVVSRYPFVWQWPSMTAARSFADTTPINHSCLSNAASDCKGLRKPIQVFCQSFSPLLPRMREMTFCQRVTENEGCFSRSRFGARTLGIGLR